MKTEHQRRIEEFMRLAGQDLPLHPVIPSAEVRFLRASIILEEALETIEALGMEVGTGVGAEFVPTPHLVVRASDKLKPNLIEIADGCADTSVVTIGTLSACGIADNQLLMEVDASNLRKFGLGSYRRADGKWMKSNTWTPPDILRVLKEQGYENRQ